LPPFLPTSDTFPWADYQCNIVDVERKSRFFFANWRLMKKVQRSRGFSKMSRYVFHSMPIRSCPIDDPIQIAYTTVKWHFPNKSIYYITHFCSICCAWKLDACFP
jgi:hypothetical protein